jgi:hypothetical protein
MKGRGRGGIKRDHEYYDHQVEDNEVRREMGRWPSKWWQSALYGHNAVTKPTDR